MANDLTNAIPKILARALFILRSKSSMPMLVNGDFSTEAAQKGATIDIPTYETAATVTDVVPSATNPALVDVTPGLVQIPMEQWKMVSFHLSDKEVLQINEDEQFVPQQLARAVEGLAKEVNQHLFDNYKGVYGFVGEPGVTPFEGNQGVTPATDSRMLLNIQKCPDDDKRFGMLDPMAEGSALNLEAFSHADKAGNDSVITRGIIGQKFGSLWMWDHDVPYHTAGNWEEVTINAVNSAAAEERTSTVTVATGGAPGALDLNEGDIIEIAGHQYTYAVISGPGDGTTAALGASSSGSIVIAPGLRAATVSGEAITVKASHRVNLHMHRDAISLAWRPLASSNIGATANDMFTLQDPLTKLILRVEIKRVHKAVVWEIDALYGSNLVRPQFAVRIAG